jgi:hypothetical protein
VANDIQCGLDSLYASLCDVRKDLAQTAAALATASAALMANWATSGGPKVDYSIDGQSVTRSSAMRQYTELTQRQKTLLEVEAGLIEAIIRAEGPFQVMNQAWV